MIHFIDQKLYNAFTKFAHWLDYRWHINNFLAAKWIMQFAAVLSVTTGMSFFIPFPKWQDAAFDGLIAVVNIFIAMSYMKRAEKLDGASKRYEAGHEYFVPTLTVTFFMAGPWPRLISGALPFLFLGPLALAYIHDHHGWAYISICIFIRTWLMWGDCIGPYMAMVIPPTRKRKKKKARDWSFGPTPATAGSRG